MSNPTLTCEAVEWGIIAHPCSKAAKWTVVLPEGDVSHRCTEHKDRVMYYQAKRGAVAEKIR